jgi:hypothetical protein
MRASAHRMASARLFAMPGDQRVDDFQLRRFEPDHYVGDVARSRFALVVEGDDEAAPAVATGIFEPDPEVLDLRPPLGQLAPELLDGRAVGVLEFLKCRAGLGPPAGPDP